MFKRACVSKNVRLSSAAGSWAKAALKRELAPRDSPAPFPSMRFKMSSRSRSRTPISKVSFFRTTEMGSGGAPGIAPSNVVVEQDGPALDFVTLRGDL